MSFPTRENNTLDQVYTNIPDAYKATPLPHLGLSDHLSLSLIPAYKPKICRQKQTKQTKTIKTVQVWTEEATAALQDCFDSTDWGIFAEGTDLESHTSAVLSCISYCTESVITTRTVKVFPNQKPWLNSKVRTLLRAQDVAFRSGDQQAYREARQALQRGIEKAKHKHKQCIEDSFDNNNTRNMWQGIKELTGYKDKQMLADSSDSTLPDTLNQFFARFDQRIGEARTCPVLPERDDAPIQFQQHQVRATLRSVDVSQCNGDKQF